MRKLHKHWASSSTESMAARPQQQGSGELCSFALRNQKHSEHFTAKQFEKGGKHLRGASPAGAACGCASQRELRDEAECAGRNPCMAQHGPALCLLAKQLALHLLHEGGTAQQRSRPLQGQLCWQSLRAELLGSATNGRAGILELSSALVPVWDSSPCSCMETRELTAASRASQPSVQGLERRGAIQESCSAQ